MVWWAAEKLKKLEDNGLVLHDVVMVDPKGELDVVEEVHCDIEHVLTVDLAMLLKMGECAATSHKCCPFCDVHKQAHT